VPRTTSPRLLLVWAALVALTAVSVVVEEDAPLGLDGRAAGLLILAVALVKASAVAWEYMEAGAATRALRIGVAVALCGWLALVGGLFLAG